MNNALRQMEIQCSPFRSARKPISNDTSIHNSPFAQFVFKEVPKVTRRETSGKLRNKDRPSFRIVFLGLIGVVIFNRRIIFGGTTSGKVGIRVKYEKNVKPT